MSTDALPGQLAETWRIHDRINLYLLDAISDDALPCIGPTKGRSVAEQFAHVHNVRLMWLKEAAPELMEGLSKIEKGDAMDRGTLRAVLEASSAAWRRCWSGRLRRARCAGSSRTPPRSWDT